MSLADDLVKLRALGWSWSRIAAHYRVSERAVRRWRTDPPEGADRLPRPSVLDWETHLVLSDLQYPYHDRDLVELVVGGLVPDLDLDGLLWNGDILDLPQLSRFSPNPYLLGLARDDVASWQAEVRGPLIDAVGGAAEVLIKGNHEDRDRRYIQSVAPALAGIVSSHQFFQMPDEVPIFEYGKGIGPMLGDILVNHGWRAQAHSAYTAKNSVADVGVSVLLGHTHRLGHYATRTIDPRTQSMATMHGYEMGHMCDEGTVPKATTGVQDWQQCAGAVVKVKRDGSAFDVDLLPVVDERWVHYDGRVYEVERSRRLWAPTSGLSGAA